MSNSQSIQGVPIYGWGKWPEHLLTKKQMADAGYQTGKKLPLPAGAVYRSKSPGGIMWLYDQAQGVPKAQPTEAQLAALEKAQHQADIIWLTCDRCGANMESGTRKRIEVEQAERPICFECDARMHAMKWARDHVTRGGFVILDTETTGLGADDEICEIAIIDARGEVLLNTLVRPQDPQKMLERHGLSGPSATSIHGITPDEVASAPTWADVYPDMVRLTADRPVLVYNASFDLRMVQGDSVRAGLPYIEGKNWQCVMERYAWYVGEWSDYFGSFKWQPLQGGDHRALGDCRATLDVLRRMANIEDSDDAAPEPSPDTPAGE